MLLLLFVVVALRTSQDTLSLIEAIAVAVLSLSLRLRWLVEGNGKT